MGDQLAVPAGRFDERRLLSQGILLFLDSKIGDGAPCADCT